MRLLFLLSAALMATAATAATGRDDVVLRGEPVQMRGLEIGGAIDAQVGPAQIVGEDENDVRLLGPHGLTSLWV